MLRKERLWALPTLLLVLSSCWVSFAAHGASLDDRMLCGPKCVTAISQLYGVKTDIEEIVALSAYDATTGANMAGLYTAAKAKGLAAAGVKVGIDDLLTLGVPFIAHFWNNHFAIVEVSGGVFSITNPPEKTRSVPVEDFGRSYSGFALLVAKDNTSLPKFTSTGADLRLSRYVSDMGSIEEDSLVEQAVTCSNQGNENLTISKIEISAEHLSAFVDEQVLPPGGRAEINVILDTTGLRGPQRQTLYIHSNDPITPVVQLQVHVDVEPTKVLFSPTTVDFGMVRKGDKPSRHINIRRSKVRDIQVSDVTCDNPFVIANITEGTEARGPQVTLALSPDVPIGELSGIVSIFTNHPKDAKIDVPVRGNVKGDIDVFPETLFFGILKEGSGGSKKIKFSSLSKKAFDIIKIDNPLSHLTLEAEPKAEGASYTLTGTLAEDTPVGYMKNEIVVHTSDPDQAEIRIPVHALVE